MSRGILKLIASETFGESYMAHKIELDLEANASSRIDEREPLLVNPKCGETIHYTSYRPLEGKVRGIANSGMQILTYFLDGSRHVYKIDDIAYRHGNSRKMVYPVVAGQVVVGCCGRRDRKMFAEQFNSEVVLSLPSVANADRNSEGFWASLVRKINAKLDEQRFRLRVSKILKYSISRESQREQKFEERAIACVQDHMYQAEQNMVATLVSQGKLDQKNYLVKDGSLEYRIPTNLMSDERKFMAFKSNYGYVVGVSKKFNPALWTTGTGINAKPNPGVIAELPLYHRTPVLRFDNPDYHGDIKFAVWYLRLRSRCTESPFDGVVKVEKMLVRREEAECEKIDSEEVDTLSAYLINERNPVCYGSDSRWANHIYPIFLTESFVKSKCMSAETFLHMF